MTEEYTGANGRAVDRFPHACPAVGEFDARFKAGTDRMARLEAKIDGNPADTREVLDILHAGKGFFKVVGSVGNIAKWPFGVGAPLVAFWYALKNGGKP